METTLTAAAAAVAENSETLFWVEQQLSRFDVLLRNAFHLPLAELTEHILYEIAKTGGCIQGVFYLLDENQTLNAAAGYACRPENLTRNHFKVGEGLVGQAARNGEVFALDNLHAGFDVQTGLTRIAARSVIIQPILYNNQTVGVVELCFLQNYDLRFLALLPRLSVSVGAAIQSILNRQHIQRILEDTQTKNNELLSKEEELRQNLEELEATQDELHRQKQQLQDKEQSLQSLIQNAPGAVFRCAIDQHYTMLFASDKILDITGFSAQDFMAGKASLASLIFPEDTAAVDQQIDIALRAKKTYEIEYRLVRADKTVIYVWEMAKPIFPNEGTPYLEGFLMDITLQKQKAQELEDAVQQLQANDEEMRQSLEELEATQEQMRLYQTELQNQKAELEAAVQQLQANDEEMTQNLEELEATQEQMTIYQTELQNQKAELEAAVQQLQANEEEMRQNLEELEATQEQMRLTQEELENQKAELEAAVQQLQANDEEMRQNLEELEATQEQMRVTQEELEKQKTEQDKFVALVRHSMNHILIANDETFVVEYANELAEAYFDLGETETGVFTAAVTEFLAVEGKDSLNQLLKKIRREKMSWQGELRLNTPDPNYQLFFRAVVFCLADSAKQKNLGLAFILEDITQQKNEEAEYKAAKAEIERLKAEIERLKKA